MITLVLLLAGAAVGYGLSRALGLPSTPLLLLAGFGLSVTGLLPEGEMLENTLLLGVGFLLFATGTELDLQRVGRHRRAALRVGLVQFVVLGGLALGAAMALGFDVEAALYIGIAVAASSTLVVVRLLQQRRQLFEPFGRMIIGVLLLQDILVIVLAPVLIRLPDGLIGMFLGLGQTLVLLGLAYALQRWILPALVLRSRMDGEVLLLTALGLLFGFIGLAGLFDLPFITGAFLAGFALASFPISGMIREQIIPITDFFTPLFFTVLGAFVLVPTVQALAVGAVLALVVLVATPIVVTAVAEYEGFSARSALESGLLLAQTSELSLIVGLLALTSGAIGPDVFSVIVLVTAVTMVATPFISAERVVWQVLSLHPSHAARRPAAPPSDHILMLGCGESGMPLLETLFLAGYDVLVIDDDPTVVRYLQDNEIPSLRGDAAEAAILTEAGAPHARAVIAMVRRPSDVAPVITRAGGVPVFVRVFTDEDADAIERAGGIPVRYAEAASASFLEWFDQQLAAHPTGSVSPSDT
jgi:Kef-type K+ transport system membrane component KefB